jgi:acetyltransferase-like isoleucine patch superfamily enzyme
MATDNHSSSSNLSPQYWLRRGELMAETLSTVLTGWLPTRIGDRIRSKLYQSLLPQIGQPSRIGQNWVVHCAHRIKIGEAVNIGHSVCCDASPTGNEILIGDRVKLGDNVLITGAGTDARIVLHNGVSLDRGVDLKAHDNGYIEVGEGTYIGPYVCLAGPGSIRLGRNCLIASHVGMYANSHNFSDVNRPINSQGLTCKGIEIEDDCWLGSGVKIVDGVRIGKGSVIGAGAVVTRNIPSFSVAVGVPARVISRRDRVSPNSRHEIANLNKN